MKKLFLALTLFVNISIHAQIQYGTWKTPSGNPDYHHFTRNGNGAAVYINQSATGSSFPILRLSSGTELPNQNVKLTVENDGRVGIGTISPTNGLLHIYKNATTGGLGSVATSNAGLRIQDSFSSLYLDGNTLYTDGNMVLGTLTNSSFSIGTNNVENFRINSGGNIGIGTTNPSEKLHIEETTNGESISFRLRAPTATGAGRSWYMTGDPDTRKLHIGEESTSSDLVINQNGNIGIGTTNPTQKLQVAGTVYSTEVKVELAAGQGPDYVFEPDYELRTLQETKEFISENKHLPEIPSAKEMEANGVELGDMNMKLLKKIEELTLYVIEQNERLQQLESKDTEIEELKKEIELLKKD